MQPLNSHLAAAALITPAAWDSPYLLRFLLYAPTPHSPGYAGSQEPEVPIQRGASGEPMAGQPKVRCGTTHSAAEGGELTWLPVHTVQQGWERIPMCMSGMQLGGAMAPAGMAPVACIPWLLSWTGLA